MSKDRHLERFHGQDFRVCFKCGRQVLETFKNYCGDCFLESSQTPRQRETPAISDDLGADYIATFRGYLDACKAEDEARSNKLAALDRLTELQKKIAAWIEKEKTIAVTGERRGGKVPRGILADTE